MLPELSSMINILAGTFAEPVPVPGGGVFASPELGIKRPTAPQRIAQILSGRMGYGDIAQRVIKRLLLQRS